MNKKLISLSVMSLILLGSMARPLYAADVVKVGTVNLQKALNEVKQGKMAKEALRQAFDAKRSDIAGRQTELKNLQAEFTSQRASLPKTALVAKRQVYGEKVSVLKTAMKSYREDMIAKESRVANQILSNLKSIVSEIGQKEGYTMIVETSQNDVLYSKLKAKDDLTSRVITLYNQRYPAPLNIQ